MPHAQFEVHLPALHSQWQAFASTGGAFESTAGAGSALNMLALP